MSDFEMIEQEQNHKGFDDSNIENDFNPKKKSGVPEKPYFLELSIEEKYLIEVLFKLNIPFTNITHINLWGGEPLLDLSYFNSALKDLFQIFPNINSFWTSTNFNINIENLVELF